MNIRFNIKKDEYVTITKSANYGFTLEHFYPTFNPKTKQPTVGSKSLFYATLPQVVDSMVALSERIAATLEKM